MNSSVKRIEPAPFESCATFLALPVIWQFEQVSIAIACRLIVEDFLSPISPRLIRSTALPARRRISSSIRFIESVLRGCICQLSGSGLQFCIALLLVCCRRVSLIRAVFTTQGGGWSVGDIIKFRTARSRLYRSQMLQVNTTSNPLLR